MVKFLSTVFIVCSVSFSQNLFRTDRIDQITIADVSAGIDSTIASKARGIKADVGGVVKLQISPAYGDPYVTVEYLPDGIWLPVGNVVKVYQYYTGTTATTCQVYDSTGTLINGIKIGK